MVRGKELILIAQMLPLTASTSTETIFAKTAEAV